MTRPQPIDANWYDYQRFYDVAMRSETAMEADFVEAACRKYCRFRVKRLLEPGCGAGRLVAEMASRGYEMVGLDRNRPSLDYLRRRLAQRRLKANVFEADMAEFGLSKRVDAAFCTVNTFRHLLTEKAARRHLECIAQSLRPGGIWIVGRTWEHDCSNHVSLLRRSDRGWELLERIGTGWEMEPAALGGTWV